MGKLHPHRGRMGRTAIGVLALSTAASVLGLTPAAEAQPYKIKVGDCKAKSFIRAIEMANAAAETDIIVLKYKCKYEFSNPYFDAGSASFTANALPVITDDLTIYGNKAKADGDVDAGSGGFRFMEILETNGDIAVEVRDLTIYGFELSVPPTDPTAVPIAGAILNVGADLTLRGSTVRDNEINVLSTAAAPVPQAFGGGVFSVGGSLTLRSTTVSGNEVNLLQLSGGTATAVVGGVGSSGGAGIDIANSRVKANKVNGVGIGSDVRSLAGGLAVDQGGELTMDRTTVSGNSVSAKTSGGRGPNSGSATGGILLGPTDLIHEIARSTVTVNRVSAKGGPFTALAGAISNSNAGDAGVAGLLVDEHDAPSFADLDDVDEDDKTSISYNTVWCDGVCRAQGGGYVNAEGRAGAPGTADFHRTVFKGNVADGDEGMGVGGAIAVGFGFGSPVVILDDATVTKNKAKGDAFAHGGGIFAESPDEVDLNESDVFRNKPDDCWALSVGDFCDFS